MSSNEASRAALAGCSHPDVYDWADGEVTTCPRCETGFTHLLSARPYLVPPPIRAGFDARWPLIRSFQQTSVEIFRAALRGETDRTVLHWLMNETLECFGLGYHRSLEDRHFTLPVFYRTDEAKAGRIIEINCPAALWGHLQLAFEHAARLGYDAGVRSPAEQFALQLADLLADVPRIHQFVDNAGSPTMTRYFMEKTRPTVRYWGLDRVTSRLDCNFIRPQTFVSICLDDQFSWRMSRVGRGVTYEAPPYTLFDQKASLVLPFWSMTRDAFSDNIRALFPFTTPLLPHGIELPCGRCASIEEFSQWPRSRRAYYLKYAGADWSLNYGSKAVYRLSNMSGSACLDLLQKCAGQFERGQIWLLQQEETQDDEISYFARDGRVLNERLRARLSGFYGPSGCLGVLALHGRHNKVHGQEDTVFSFVLTDSESVEPTGHCAISAAKE